MKPLSFVFITLTCASLSFHVCVILWHAAGCHGEGCHLPQERSSLPRPGALAGIVLTGRLRGCDDDEDDNNGRTRVRLSTAGPGDSKLAIGTASLRVEETGNKTGSQLLGGEVVSQQRIKRIQRGVPSGEDLVSAVPHCAYLFQSPADVKAAAEQRFTTLGRFPEPLAGLCRQAAEVDIAMATDGQSAYRGLVLLWIHSSPDHATRRSYARSTWASRKIFSSLGMPVVPVFAIGQSADPKVRKLVLQEASTHMDIVMLNFVDAYRNISYKVVGGMLWVKEHCPQARVFMKADDDTAVFPLRFNRWLEKVHLLNDSLTIRGLYTYQNTEKYKDAENKYYVSPEEWPPKYFATRAAPGLAYFLSVDLFPYMFAAMRAVPWVWLEDVWITGTLPEALIAAGVPVRRVSTGDTVVEHQLRRIQKDMYAGLREPLKCIVGKMPMKWRIYKRLYGTAADLQ